MDELGNFPQLYPKRDQVVSLLRERHVKPDGSPQARRHGAPYFLHPLAVTEILVNRFHETRRHVLIAGDTHDLLEDTQTTYAELAGWYGVETADIVHALTKPPKVKSAGFYIRSLDGVDYSSEDHEAFALAYYKTLRKAPPGALEIKVCDRLHNLSEAQFTDDKFQRRYLMDTTLLIAAIETVTPYEYLAALKDAYWMAARVYAA